MREKEKKQVKKWIQHLKGPQKPSVSESGIRGYARKNLSHVKESWPEKLDEGPLIKLHYPPV